MNSLVAASAASVTPSSASEILLNHGACFIDSQRSTVVFGTVQARDRLFSVLLVHRDKTESLRTACVAIRDDGHSFDRAECREEIAEVVLRCLKGQISYVNFLRQFFTHL